MDILKPPTDNLYKFIFIVSIIAILNSIYQVDKLRNSKTELLSTISKNTKEISTNQDDFLQQLKNLSSRTDQIIKWFDGLNRKFESTDQYEKELNYIIEQNEILDKDRDYILKNRETYESKKKELRKQTKLLEEELEQLNETFGFHFLIIALFSLFAIPSFFTWLKQQRFSDKILEKNYFAAKNYYSNCQSCNSDITEYFDKEKPMKYCESCYKDGSFIELDISLKDFKTKLDSELKGHGKNWIERQWYLSDIEFLERWSPKFKRP